MEHLGSTATPGVYDPQRSIFLGNLPFDADEEGIIGFVEGCEHLPELKEQVEGVRVVRDIENKKGKGIAFVLLKSKVMLG